MKKIKNAIIVLASFLAGIVFIVRCGGGTSNLAGAVDTAITKAIDVIFDNTDTSLDSETTQAALTEIANTIPFVYDANGNKVGIFQTNDGSHWFVYDLEVKLPIFVEPVTGFTFGYSGTLVYANADCSGTAYFPFGTNYIGTSLTSPTALNINQSTQVIYVDGKNYWHKMPGGTVSTIKAEDIKSFKTSRYIGYTTTTCFNLSETLSEPGTISMASSITTKLDLNKIIPLYIEAEEITLPTYTGPLNFSKP